jgi:hypothetical protein
MRKDETLDSLAETINVAQFVAFEPTPAGPRQTFARISGRAANARFATPEDAVANLFESSGEKSLNVRSYLPEDKQSKEFVYGLRSVDDVIETLRRLTSEGLHTIVNETVDVTDGGVSGVVLGNVIEFAPDATPRAVEKDGAASLPRHIGLGILETVYGFRPPIDVPPDLRLEFSVHPRPRGWRHGHTLGWEFETVANFSGDAHFKWPNAFSRMIGDKLFGLLVAQHLGLNVPRTVAIPRRVSPFSFGEATGSAEVWIRTCPREQQPGEYMTARGWMDPFQLLADEDPAGEAIASILSQAAVRGQWSGASLVLADGRIVVEGKAGEGSAFMAGAAKAEPLPARVKSEVLAIHAITEQLGPIRFEWVHDGESVWIVQLHRGASRSTETMIFPGEPGRWVRFDPEKGLGALRTLLGELGEDTGVEFEREVGRTSHMADVLRRAEIPSRFVTG